MSIRRTSRARLSNPPIFLSEYRFNEFHITSTGCGCDGVG